MSSLTNSSTSQLAAELDQQIARNVAQIRALERGDDMASVASLENQVFSQAEVEEAKSYLSEQITLASSSAATTLSSLNRGDNK